MCGRFTLRTPTPVLLERFRVSTTAEWGPRYNIAPTQEVAVIVRPADPPPRRELTWMRWGLVPSWARDPSAGARMINARSETVGEKPAFRASFARRRCLVLADGYYEWQPSGGKKQPFLIHRVGNEPFAMAGLWDTWRGRAGAELDPPLHSCTIITTEANEWAARLHDRMPVILEASQLDRWLGSPAEVSREELKALLQPYAGDDLQADAVSTYVNNPRHEGPECVRTEG